MATSSTVLGQQIPVCVRQDEGLSDESISEWALFGLAHGEATNCEVGIDRK